MIESGLPAIQIEIVVPPRFQSRFGIHGRDDEKIRATACLPEAYVRRAEVIR